MQLETSTRRHPQTDEASELMSRMLKNNLKCCCSYPLDDFHQLVLSADIFTYQMSEDLEISLSEIDVWWQLRALVNVISEKGVPEQSVNDLEDKLKISLDNAQFYYYC